MHRATKDKGLTEVRMEAWRRAQPLHSTTTGRHVGLDRMCLLMEVQCIKGRCTLGDSELLCWVCAVSQLVLIAVPRSRHAWFVC
jgi:hypothetical protein